KRQVEDVAKPSGVHCGRPYPVKLHCSHMSSQIAIRPLHNTRIYLIRKRKMENYIHNQKFSNQTFKSLTNKPTPKTDIQEIETLEIKLVASFTDSSNSNMRKQALRKLVQDMFRSCFYQSPKGLWLSYLTWFLIKCLLWGLKPTLCAALVGGVKNQGSAMGCDFPDFSVWSYSQNKLPFGSQVALSIIAQMYTLLSISKGDTHSETLKIMLLQIVGYNQVDSPEKLKPRLKFMLCYLRMTLRLKIQDEKSALINLTAQNRMLPSQNDIIRTKSQIFKAILENVLSGDLSGQKSDSEGSQYDINMGSDIQLPSPAQTSNIQIQTKPVLESLDMETQTNFLLYRSFNSMGYSNFLGLEMKYSETLQLFRSADLSDIEIQTEELLLLKYTCLEGKVHVSSIETQKMSIGFETWGFFFFHQQ
ncbi:hypothetical protein E2I00_009726, partial [Balaenoptera physalus]